MKNIIFLTYLIFILSTPILFCQETVLFSEDFEGGTIPALWSQKKEKGTINWVYRDGGYSTKVPDDDVLLRRPPGAYNGNYNAMFQIQNTIPNAYITKLITRQITNMEFAIKPELRFYHAQDEWYHGYWSNDELRVYYKNGVNNNWIKLAEYTSPVPNWTERIILLPDSTLTDDYYIAFEGEANWGYGTCIDNIQIVETGVATRFIDTIYMEQVSTLPVSSGLGYYKMFQLTIKVKGNQDNLILNSINLSSLNTNDNDIAENGVKLFRTNELKFATINQLTSGASFSDGVASLSGINYQLQTGFNYFWITYEIDSTGTNGNYVDGEILANGINISGSNYPSYNMSPSGNRQIYESVFFDDFDSDKGWNLISEFQIDTPRALGGRLNIGDPEHAVSGRKVLGTDLSGLGIFDGDYEYRLTKNAYRAVTPIIDLTYYKDIDIRFKRWLNIYFNDTVAIEVSNNNGQNWQRIWYNPSSIAQSDWSTEEYDISLHTNRMDSVLIRFCLGGTDTTTNVSSGWNIDDFSVTGNYIENDVGVLSILAPTTGCGHTSTDDVTAIIKNYGPATSEDTIPVAYSIDGGTTFYIDTMFSSIAYGGTATFTFPTKADLSSPGAYNLVLKTLLDSDEDNTNDQFDTSITVIPIYDLPYSENFESNNGYWHVGGKTNMWEWGVPQSGLLIINGAASGEKAWVTNLEGNYQTNDSVFLESPCFNFNGIKNPVFECNVIYDTKRFKDGASFYYSIDDGITWDYLDTLDYKWEWEWYSDTIEKFGKPGLDSTTTDWIRIHQFLPKETSNQSNVKLRLLFMSDTVDYFREGVGFDDPRIFEAPPDVGITELVAPDSACEFNVKQLIKVAVMNYAYDTLFSGTKIPLGFDLDGSLYTVDTLTLSSNLLPEDTVHFTFSDSVEMHSAGRYYFDIYTLLAGDNDYYIDTLNNDTLSTFISVYGMPDYDLGPTIGMETIDTIVDAGAGYSSYNWENGDELTRYYHITSAGTYSVTVVNVHGCIKSDSVRVLQSVEDLGVISLVTPLSDCEFPNDTTVKITIKNFKGATYNIGDTIIVGYQLNNSAIKIDSIFLSSPLGALGSFDQELSYHFDLSDFEDYQFRFYTILEGDLEYSNDTLETTISAWGYPDVEIGPDTLFTSRADTITFNAGAGFNSYLWQNGSANQTFTPPNRTSKEYTVTVTDVHSCGEDSDSVQIIAYDLSVISLSSPVNACILSSNETVTIRVRNNGQDTIPSLSTIPVSYKVDNLTTVNGTINLSSSLLPNGYVDYSFTTLVNMSTIKGYNISAFVNFPKDINRNNDTLKSIISNWGYPIVNLGTDTIYTALADTVLLIANPGYASYEWNTGDSDDTLIVMSTATRWYSVTVTSIHGCVTKDSTFIYTHDVGILNISSPINDCELSSNEEVLVSIINNASSTIPSGTIIPLRYSVNGGSVISENCTLSVDLDPISYINYEFVTTIDMEDAGSYVIEAYTEFFHDVVPDNDDFTKEVLVYGYPVVDIGPDTLFTALPDTVTLVAFPGYASYQWNTGSTNNSINITALSSARYKVIVKNDNNCSASDSLFLYAYDIGITGITSPTSDCELTGTENITVVISNLCSDTFKIGEEIDLAYRIDSESPVIETYTLVSDLLPGSSVNYTFATQGEFEDVDDYSLNAYTLLYHDVSPENNMTIDTIHVYGYPNINLGNDTTIRALEYVLDAGGTYNNYLWQDGSTQQTYSVDSSGTYYVTIEDIYGCGDSDTINIIMLIPDFTIISLVNPQTKCYNNGLVQPLVRMQNTGTDTIKAGETVNIGYYLNNNFIEQQQFTINSNLYPDDEVNFTFTNLINVLNYQTHQFKVYSNFSRDLIPVNDTVLVTKTIYPFPTVNLGNDVTVSTKQYQLDAGYNANYSYLWQDNSTNQTFTVQYDGSLIKSCNVTVSDTRILNCSSQDAILITFRITDIIIDSIILQSPVCQFQESDAEVIVRNNGNTNIQAAEPIVVGYINAEGISTEYNSGLTKLLLQNQTDTIPVTDISINHGGSRNVKFYINMEEDVDPVNDTLVRSVTTNPAPESEMGGESDTIETALPATLTPLQGQSNYTWNNGTHTSSLSASSENWYWVDITGTNGCVARDSVYVMLEVSIIPLSAQDAKIYIYPLPASELLNIVSENELNEDYDFIIYDSQGRYIETGRLFKNQKAHYTLNIENLASGFYYIKIYNNTDSYTRTLIFNTKK